MLCAAMKLFHPKIQFAPALLALALLALPAIARADEPTPEKKLSKAQEKYDSDKDGTLSAEERAKAREDALAKARQTREEHRKIALEKYDANHDGKLDGKEKAKMKADAAMARETQKAARDARKAERAARKAERDAKKTAASDEKN